jgi:CoA-transferase family III
MSGHVMSRVDALLALLNQCCTSIGSLPRYDIRLLTERAILSGFTRGGRESCNRSCRLIEARDGWIALNLPRDDDWAALPALLGCDIEIGSWPEVVSAIRGAKTDELVANGRLLGLPIAAAIVPVTSALAVPTFIAGGVISRGRTRDWKRSPPLVVDLSALWAGPLCGQILAESGARVIKVESIRRPDTIRHTSPAFFDLLNAGKESIALDFGSATDLERLRALIRSADLVIGSARPRAFEQMDLVPEALMQSNPGLNWVAITAYGWYGENRNAVGFGDDVAAAAGLISWCDGQPSFIADAIADPLTGIAAAVAAIDAIAGGGVRGAGGAHGTGGTHRVGGGVLVDASLYASAAYVATADAITI